MIEGRPSRVLVVDDDSMTRELLQLLLTRHGYVAELAESGEAALVILADKENQPDAVLADLQMPGITGSLLADKVRSMCGDNLRVIAMSGSEAGKAALDGYDGFLRKPFSMDALDCLLAGEAPFSSRERSESNRAPILNQKIYEQLLGSMGEKKTAELYALCLEDGRRRIAAIRQEAAHGNDEICRKQAHAIKGSCKMVGAIEMANLAEYIEVHGVTTTLMDTLDELLRACGGLERMLSQHRSTQHDSAAEETARRSHA
jgi:CheY-like chemotaxis protein